MGIPSALSSVYVLTTPLCDSTGNSPDVQGCPLSLQLAAGTIGEATLQLGVFTRAAQALGTETPWSGTRP